MVDYDDQVFNVALLDILPNGTLSDLTVSNNSDMPKVLATVFRALEQFFKLIRAARVLLSGSSPSRTRLYQMAISKYLHELELKFEVLREIRLKALQKGETMKSLRFH
ncbi:hypothetical protein D9M68_928420 [compost metagenome]